MLDEPVSHGGRECVELGPVPPRGSSEGLWLTGITRVPPSPNPPREPPSLVGCHRSAWAVAQAASLRLAPRGRPPVSHHPPVGPYATIDGLIVLDDKTTLAGVPESAWHYRLGSRSALEWFLDQYKERKPRDPTIAAKFNAYRFADHKERVIDLLDRVCAVSVRTMDIVDGMAHWEDGKLVVYGDRDEHEQASLGSLGEPVR